MSHIAIVTADLDGFRAFYEDTIGLETTMVVGAGPGHARQAVIHAGDAMLHVFEVLEYDADAHGSDAPMFERGRLDHFGFTVADAAGLAALRDRLVAAGASSGDIRRLGPMLSMRFHDPEGFEGEVNCLDPAYDPSSIRDEDEIIDPDWFERVKGTLRRSRSSRADPADVARPGETSPTNAADRSPGGRHDDRSKRALSSTDGRSRGREGPAYPDAEFVENDDGTLGGVVSDVRGVGEQKPCELGSAPVLPVAEQEGHCCIAYQEAGLVRLTNDPALASALARDNSTANVRPRQHAMLDYAAKLTGSPARCPRPAVLRCEPVG